MEEKNSDVHWRTLAALQTFAILAGGVVGAIKDPNCRREGIALEKKAGVYKGRKP
jgi:hypothetical protein